MSELEIALINRLNEVTAHLREVEKGNLSLQAELDRVRQERDALLGVPAPSGG